MIPPYTTNIVSIIKRNILYKIRIRINTRLHTNENANYYIIRDKASGKLSAIVAPAESDLAFTKAKHIYIYMY